MEQFISFCSQLFTFIIGTVFFLMILYAFAAWVQDSTQTKHSLRRNYPLLARGRWFFEYIGHFFRTYLVVGDREDRPFSKVERTYVYKAAKGNKRTDAFGSTIDYKTMDFAFINSQFPSKTDKEKPNTLTYGANTETPYVCDSRINISAMSYGALSDVAVLSLSQGAKEGNFLMNTGEGGLSKFHIEGGAPIIFQIGTAKYGCANSDLTLNEEKIVDIAKNEQVKMFEIKLSQGAKPGKGGILPANKVTTEIAEARDITKGVSSISPSSHEEINNPEDLVSFVYKVKQLTGKPVGFKLCLGSENQFDEIILAFKTKMNEAKENGENENLYCPDFITVDSADGGTGAAPLAHMDAMGMILTESLPVVVSVLNRYNMKNKVKVIASGKLLTPVEAGWAFANGADSINIGRGFLFSLGCIQARVCNKNKCPTGITTHKKKYTKGLIPENKSKRVFKYHKNLTEDLMSVAHSCGVDSFDMLSSKHIRDVNLIKTKTI